jgi:hypothetical protein
MIPVILFFPLDDENCFPEKNKCAEKDNRINLSGNLSDFNGCIKAQLVEKTEFENDQGNSIPE